MKLLRKAVVTAIVGSLIGVNIGVLTMWWAIHNTTFIGTAISGAIYGGIAGAGSGFVIALVTQVLRSQVIGEAFSKRISKIASLKFVGGIGGTGHGVIIGCIVGAIIEVIVGLARPGQFCIEKLYVTTAIGAVVGAVYGIASTMPHRAMGRLIGAAISGAAFGIGVELALGAVWFIAVFPSLGPDERIPVISDNIKWVIIPTIIVAILFGICVAAISDVIAGKKEREC